MFVSGPAGGAPGSSIVWHHLHLCNYQSFILYKTLLSNLTFSCLIKKWAHHSLTCKYLHPPSACWEGLNTHILSFYSVDVCFPATESLLESSQESVPASENRRKGGDRKSFIHKCEHAAVIHWSCLPACVCVCVFVLAPEFWLLSAFSSPSLHVCVLCVRLCLPLITSQSPPPQLYSTATEQAWLWCDYIITCV